MNAFNRNTITRSSLLSKIMLFAALACSGTAFACPDQSQYGERSTYSSSQLSSSRSFNVIAGGGVDLTECQHVPGYGWVAEAPDNTIRFNRNSRHRNLEFRVVADCDATLVVNTAGNSWRFDDDSGSALNPKIVVNNATDGFYDVWIGTNDGDTCDARLVVTATR